MTIHDEREKNRRDGVFAKSQVTILRVEDGKKKS